jgi:hypothetical protein
MTMLAAQKRCGATEEDFTFAASPPALWLRALFLHFR